MNTVKENTMNTVKLFLCLAIAAAGGLAAAPLKSDFDPKLPRRISVGKAGKYVLDKNTCVVLPPRSAPTAKFAAAELAKYLGKVFGAPIAVVTAPVAGKVSIIVGDNVCSRSLGIDVSKFDRDGFVIKTAGMASFCALGV